MFQLAGCMELNDANDGWQPRWEDPCGGADLIGCMVKNLSKWAPALEEGIGSCDIEGEGCMKLGGGKWFPVLQFENYDSEEELFAACCQTGITCPCFDEDMSPQFIKVTFEGLVPCCPDDNSIPGPNIELTLEYDHDMSTDCSLAVGSTCCVWRYGEEFPLGPADFYVIVQIWFVGEVLRIGVIYQYYGGESSPPLPSLSHLFLHPFYQSTCEGMGDSITNEQNCLICPSGASWHEDGTATIDWAP